MTAGTAPVTAGTAPVTAGTAPVTAAPAGGRALQVTRAGYGAALLLTPGLTIRLATGRRAGRRARRTAQVLGARHLAQAALTAVAPLPVVFAAGADADALHAASMLLLAAAGRGQRRTALTDAVAEAAFAAAGLAVAVSRGCRTAAPAGPPGE